MANGWMFLSNFCKWAAGYGPLLLLLSMRLLVVRVCFPARINGIHGQIKVVILVAEPHENKFFSTTKIKHMTIQHDLAQHLLCTQPTLLDTSATLAYMPLVG